jgi:uncharacterized membrane protein
MAFCPNCGAQVEGKFCAKCGTPVAADAPGAVPGVVTPPPASPMVTTAPGMTDNMAAALCYLFTILTGILFLVLEPYNRNKLIRFHAFQAIFFFVAMMAVYIVTTILSITLGALPIIGWIFAVLLHLVVAIGFLIMWLLLMYKAYNNEKWVLPFIGPLAEKQAQA